jgi:IclR family transcriptional regulator, KDG regulon repressor
MARDTVSPQIAILSCFAAGPSPLTAADILRLSGLPRSTAFRCLRLLTDQGFLLRDGDQKRYILGPRILRLGVVARSQLSSDELLAGPLERLAATAGETVTFSILDRRDRICTYVVDAPSDLRFEARLGERYPIHLGAAGKVILANLAPETIESVLEDTGMTKPKIRQVTADLDEIRGSGFAMTDSERVPGAIAVAAPVFSGDAVFGSVAIVGPSARGGDVIARHRPILLRTAKELTQRFSSEGDGIVRPQSVPAQSRSKQR